MSEDGIHFPVYIFFLFTFSYSFLFFFFSWLLIKEMQDFPSAMMFAFLSGPWFPTGIGMGQEEERPVNACFVCIFFLFLFLFLDFLPCGLSTRDTIVDDEPWLAWRCMYTAIWLSRRWFDYLLLLTTTTVYCEMRWSYFNRKHPWIRHTPGYV